MKLIHYNNKFILIVFLLSICSLLWRCSPENNQLYDVRLEAPFTIPAGLNTIETHYFYVRNVPTLYSFWAKSNGIDTSDINSVLSSGGQIESAFQSIDFELINRVSVYAVSQNDPNFKREILYLDFVPVDIGNELRLLASTTQLKEIMQDELIDIEIRINLRQFTPTNINANLLFGYSVM